MNAPTTFNTLAFVRKLEASGMDVRQAEALADALGDIVFDTTATKGDLATIRSAVREDLTAVRTDLRELELKIAADLRALELRLMPRLGAALGASTALTVAIIGALITWHR